MSEVYFSTKNLQPFASNYRSTANTYNFYYVHVHVLWTQRDHHPPNSVHMMEPCTPQILSCTTFHLLQYVAWSMYICKGTHRVSTSIVV